MVGNHARKQLMQPRNVPLSRRQREQRLATSACRVLAEDLIETTAAGKKLERVIKHQKRFWQRVDNGKRKEPRLGQILDVLHNVAPSGGSVATSLATGAPRHDRWWNGYTPTVEKSQSYLTQVGQAHDRWVESGTRHSWVNDKRRQPLICPHR